MAEVIGPFLSYLQHEKRFSRHTLVSYETDLRQFSDYLRSQYQMESPADAGHLLIRSWVVQLMENGLDPRSVNRKITALRSFYRYLVRTGVMLRSPMLKVQGPKTRKKLPEYLDEQKMDRILLDKRESSEQGTFEELRDLLVLDFFYRTGVRLSELIGLKTEDINLYNLTVRVLGKRNKVRQIPITNAFKQVLEVYLKARAVFLNEQHTSNTWFFVDNKGNQMASGFVYRLVKRRIGEVSTGVKKSPHVLRHTFATTMLNHGADINAIKELLGHSSLAATQVYTHNSIEKLKEVYQQAFPKA